MGLKMSARGQGSCVVLVVIGYGGGKSELGDSVGKSCYLPLSLYALFTGKSSPEVPITLSLQ